MKRNSLHTKISLFFLLFVVLLLVFYFSISIVFAIKEGFDFNKRIFDNMRMIDVKYANKQKLSDIGMAFIEPEKVETMNVFSFLVPPKPKRPEFREKNESRMLPPMLDRQFKHKVEPVLFVNNLYQRAVILDIEGQKVGVIDKSGSDFYLYFSLAYLLVFILVSFLYWMIVRSLRPLRILEKEIGAFGGGQVPVSAPPTKQGDEIARIHTLFYDTATRINALMESRDIFLKNTAHELKTPIAKGFVVTQLIKEEKYKDWLYDIFTRMHEIIENLMTAEEVYAKDFTPKIEQVELYPLCVEIRENLFLSEAGLEIDEHGKAQIFADKNLLKIALTNLIDNAIKFSDDKKAICIPEEGRVTIKNSGAPLQAELETYCEPFYKETSLRNESGMGLGLYLVKKVLDIQHLKLNYLYKDGYNIFYIE